MNKEQDLFTERVGHKIADSENGYIAKLMSPTQLDALADSKCGETPVTVSVPPQRKRRRLDQVTSTPSTNDTGTATPRILNESSHGSELWDQAPAPGTVQQWAETPGCVDTPATPRTQLAETQTHGSGTVYGGRWDETYGEKPWDSSGIETLGLGWAETPRADYTQATGAIDKIDATLRANPSRSKPKLRWEETPLKSVSTSGYPSTVYEIISPPSSCVSTRTPNRRSLATATPLTATPMCLHMHSPDVGGTKAAGLGDLQSRTSGNLPMMKPEDMQYFDKLAHDVDEDALSPEEAKEREIMKLLLKIKTGTPPMRKSALRQISDHAREFEAGQLFNQILPLVMSPTLEDQERHLLVKVIDRVLFNLDDFVRPYVHKILVVIEPLLIDKDYYARVAGREIISSLSKAAGLATMISTMRPDIDNMDEYVRNTTARAFAVVASALGIPSLLPFLGAVCRSRRSWQARHTGIKIVQQISILMGCAILPHLKSLVKIIENGLIDDQQKVRVITALALAALAEAATPYGIESFDCVLKPLWKGIQTHRGIGLAAFLKAIGYLIPLMSAEYAKYYTREAMLILIREFQSTDEEMKKIVLKVVEQCCATESVESEYIKSDILPPFFRHFWTQRVAIEGRFYRQLVATTVEIANKIGAAEIITRMVENLKDESEQYRRMVMDTLRLNDSSSR